jgi:hypothetical protein
MEFRGFFKHFEKMSIFGVLTGVKVAVKRFVGVWLVNPPNAMYCPISICPMICPLGFDLGLESPRATPRSLVP